MNDAETAIVGSRLHVRSAARSIALLLAAAVTTEAGSRLIAARYADGPVAPDLIFDLLPAADAASYVTTVAIAAAVVLFAVYAVRCAPAELPGFVSILAIMYLLRSAMMILTPLASARHEVLLAVPLFAHGLFPSGHTAAGLLFTRLTDRRRAPNLHRAQLAIVAVVVVSMLISRSHYSIDIVGGALLAYFVERQWATGSLFEPWKRFLYR